MTLPDPISLIMFSRQLRADAVSSYRQVMSELRPHGMLYAIVFTPSANDEEDDTMQVHKISDQETFDRIVALRQTNRVELYVQAIGHLLSQLALRERHWEASMASNTQEARDQLHAIRQERRLLERRLAGKPDYPWYSPKRWAKTRA